MKGSVIAKMYEVVITQKRLLAISKLKYDGRHEIRTPGMGLRFAEYLSFVADGFFRLVCSWICEFPAEMGKLRAMRNINITAKTFATHVVYTSVSQPFWNRRPPSP
jgi:hypothetical protein